MEQLARSSRDRYRRFVYETPDFMDYFAQATPIDLIEEIRIGSRPSRRRAKPIGGSAGGQVERISLDSLRAIPWVFSWVQSRQFLSTWYGCGWALEEYIRKNGQKGLSELRRMYKGWPFFQGLIQNIETSLAKTDLPIARKYAELVEDEKLRKKIFQEIEEEHRRCLRAVRKISNTRHHLPDQRTLVQSISLRNPYVDPLHLLQVRYLKEWRIKRRAGHSTASIQDLLLLTVNGIAFGMKSTG